MMSIPLWVLLGVVSLGGGIGALIRHAANTVKHPSPSQVRRRITAVNVVGAFFAGILLTIGHPLTLAITAGLFGSLTTLSTIAVWMADDIRHREPVHAIKILLGHVLTGVPAVLLGFLAGQMTV